MCLHFGVCCVGVSEVSIPPGASSREDDTQSAGTPRLHVLCQSHRPERPPAAVRAGAHGGLCTTLTLRVYLDP